MLPPERKGSVSMTVFQSPAGARLLPNPLLCRAKPYGPAEQAVLSLAKAAEAERAIRAWDGYRATPLHRLTRLAAAARVGEIAYKDEGCRAPLGSFKMLGGGYAVERLTPGGKQLTVTCATDGNHGRAVAWGARRAGCRAVVYVHAHVSPGRVRAIEAFGAEVQRVPGNYDDSVRQCAVDAAREGWTVVSDTSWPGYEDIPKHVMQGYTVLAAEAVRQGARPTHVFVQAGVGGLSAAVLSWFWERDGAGRPVLVVVEPDKADCLYASAAARTLITIGGELDTIMAGLSCGEPSRLAWKLLAPGADAFMAIPDALAEIAMRDLAEDRIVGGESGVAGLAGLMAASQDAAMREALRLTETSRVLVFGTEGATDPEIYARIVGRAPEEVSA
jgi:diaminopropionate ammonia-lyase